MYTEFQRGNIGKGPLGRPTKRRIVHLTRYISLICEGANWSEVAH